MMQPAAVPEWLATIRAYLAVMLVSNLAWELAQLPLYTIWQDKPVSESLLAGLHCTLGDVVVAGAILTAALAVTGQPGWPRIGFANASVVTAAFGAAATIYLERLNTRVWRSWSYSELMPVIPWIEVGLLPLLQWIILPPLALLVARRAAGWRWPRGAGQ